MGQAGWGTFVGPPFDMVKGRWRKKGKQFLLDWTTPGFETAEKDIDAGEYIDLNYTYRSQQLTLQQIHIGNKHFGSMRGVKLSSEVDFFSTKGFSTPAKYYYRLIVPLEKKLNFFFQIQRHSFFEDFGFHRADGTQATIDGDLLDISVFPDNDKKYYLAIDTTIKQPFETFSNKAHAVINGLGLLSGYMAGDAGWYFAYTKKEMSEPVHWCRNAMRDSIQGFYTPVNTNPHAWVHNRSAADKIYKADILKPVSAAVFSNLCQKLYSSIDFSASVLLMLESSVASLVFMPGGYAIVLESLADQIVDKTTSGLAPMNKALSKKVRKKLSEIIQLECAHLPKENQDILLGKISNLNQVTNKSRLRLPFDLLGIQLNDLDLKLIDTRNDFLHGRIPDLTDAGDDRTNERRNKDLYYASVRFYTLLCRLILTWIGYDNYILNHAKIQEKFTQIYLDEEYYLKAGPPLETAPE